jgi:hypothetical protein
MTKRSSNTIVLTFLFGIFTAAYIPVVLTHFFYVDDYFWVLPNSSRQQLYDHLFLGSIGTGRALAGYFEYIIFNGVQYLQPTEFDSAIRIVSIIGIVLLAYVLFLIFKTNRVSTKYAFIASILICTLPAFQVFVSWIILIFAIYGTILSALAGLISFKAVFTESRRSFQFRAIAIFTAVFLLVNSLHFYQPVAMFYWSLALIPLCMLRDQDLIKRWKAPFIVYFSVGFVSLIIHFIIIKIVNVIMGLGPFGSRTGFLPLTESAISMKIKWFLVSPLVNSLNLWNISPTFILGGIVSIIILAGILLSLRRAVLQAVKERAFNLIWNHFQKIILIIIILPLNLLPSLLVTESWATYRTIISLEASICILFFFGLMNIEEFLQSVTMLSEKLRKMIMPVMLTVLTVFVVYSAHGNVKKYFAELHSFELQYVKDIIREYGVSKLSEDSRVYVRGPDKKYFLDNRFRFEFGYFSMNEDGGFRIYDFGVYIANLALYELGVWRGKKTIHLSAYEPLPGGDNVLIIDLTKFKFYLDERFGKYRGNVRLP